MRMPKMCGHNVTTLSDWGQAASGGLCSRRRGEAPAAAGLRSGSFMERSRHCALLWNGQGARGSG